MTSDERTKWLAEVKARLERATEPPWEQQCARESPQSRGYALYYVRVACTHWTASTPYTLEQMQQDRADSEFIAHSRTDIGRLVAMVERTLEYCEGNPAFALLRSDLDHLAGEAAP